MENKRKIIGYKQPFDMEYFETKKGDIWIKSLTNSYKHLQDFDGTYLPKEIVEQWEPVYEEIKLEDLPKVHFTTFVKDGLRSKYGSFPIFIKETYPNGVIILPD